MRNVDPLLCFQPNFPPIAAGGAGQKGRAAEPALGGVAVDGGEGRAFEGDIDTHHRVGNFAGVDQRREAVGGGTAAPVSAKSW